jgi:4-amino-4-deoxy-L-arabinose transferase-like glycosyltransferase
MALALRAGSSLTAALTMNVFMSIVALVGVYLLARELSPSGWVPAAAAAVTAVQPVVTRYAVQSEAPVYFAGFALLAMAAACGAARNRAWLWPAAGALAGLANLSRNEGLLLIVIVLLSALCSHGQLRARLLRGAVTFAAYLAVMSPLYWYNLRHFGSLMPPAPRAFPFINVYEDLFALYVPRSLSVLFDYGVTHFLRQRLTMLDLQFTIALDAADPFCGVLLIAFAAIGVARSRVWAEQGDASARSRFERAGDWALRLPRGRWFVPAAYGITTFLFFAFVSPVVASTGAVAKSMVTTLPVIVIAGLDGLARLRLRPALVALVVALCLLLPSLTLLSATDSVIASNNAIGARFASWKTQLEAEAACLGRPVVVMTHNPWEFTQATGYASVMIPNGSLDEILATAKRYNVTAIEPTPTRAAVAVVALMRSGVLQQPSSLKNTGLYRISAAAPDARC